MAIACAYCGGEHDRPAAVRACWKKNGEQDIAANGDVPLHENASQSGSSTLSPQGTLSGAERRPGTAPKTAPAPVDIARHIAAASAGPDRLGRHALADEHTPVPEPWAQAERLRLGSDMLTSSAGALGRLRSAAAAGTRLLIEVDPLFTEEFDRRFGVARIPMLMTEAAPFEVGADFEFIGDELHHLLWANTIDLRNDRASWDALDRAVAAGLTPIEVGDPGDVRLTDGTAVWLDAGPLRFVAPIDGVPVLHAVTVEHGNMVIPVTNESTAELAPDQLEAVTHAGGAARIIAPAGSGKTRVLTERARHLLTNWRLPSSAVSLVAFNKRAQEEMQERTPDLVGLHVRTLNAIALAIVNGTAPFAPQPASWRTINEVDVRRIIGDLVSFPKRRNSDPVAPWIEALSLVRLGLVAPEETEARYEGDVDGFAAFWPSYRALLERQHIVDFDEQIYRALLILLSDPTARRTAQRACRAMLIDEFQDLTPAHLLLVRLLAAPGGAVFGVGDDDQTIYGYNGADPAWLINFGELFPGAGAHPLEVNYRCPGGIVDIADRLLRHNQRRVVKTIRAHSTDPGGWSIDTGVDPVAATTAAVRASLAAGAEPRDVAVLTRVNVVLAPVQVALAAEGIPVSGGVGLEFVDRTAVRSVLSWLRLASTSERDRFLSADLSEALRRPSRSFHPRINSWIAEQGTMVELFKLAGRLNNERDSDRLMEFAADIQTMQAVYRSGAATSDVVITLIDKIGLAGSVSGLDSTRRGMNRSAQGDDLTAILHLAALHDDVATFDAWLRDRLATTRSSDGVVLSTVHRVKGQEWPHVVVHHVDAQQYPHRLAEDVEEERRLFHVAITRASTHASVVVGPDPSPFVKELTSEPSPQRVVSSLRREPVATRSAAAKKTDPVADLDAVASARFDRLKMLRTELAAGKPAYVVFDNKTLAAIARVAPTTKHEFSRIPGVGPAKLDKYGDAFVELISALV